MTSWEEREMFEPNNMVRIWKALGDRGPETEEEGTSYKECGTEKRVGWSRRQIDADRVGRLREL
jgi:hypothetical protein